MSREADQDTDAAHLVAEEGLGDYEDDDAYAPVDSDDDVIDLPHRHRIPNPRNSHLQQGELNLQGLELTALPHAYACPEATFYRFCRNNRHILHKVLILTVRRTGTPVYFFIIRD